MKRYIISISLSVLIMLLFVTGLSYISKTNIESEDLLANVEIVTKEDTEVNTTEETTTTEVVTTTEAPQTTTTTTIYRVSGIGEIKGNVDIYYLNLLNTELNKLPSNLINAFVSNGWHIYVTNENIAKTVFNGKYSSVQGVTIYNDKVILIEARNNAIKESTIHEFGHYLDYQTGFKSDSSYFKLVYEEEADIFKSRITNSSCVRDEQELFAESFYYMYKNPNVLTPKAKEFIEGKISEI